MVQKADPPSAVRVRKKRKGPVSTTDKQSMSYFIAKTIESDNSYLKRDWILFVLKVHWIISYTP
jgi:hypothetical protein